MRLLMIEIDAHNPSCGPCVHKQGVAPRNFRCRLFAQKLHTGDSGAAQRCIDCFDAERLAKEAMKQTDSEEGL